MTSGIIALIVLGICVFLFITKIFSASVVGCMGCLLMVLLKVCTLNQAFSGFSSSILFLMVSSMIVGIAMFKTGCAQMIGSLAIKWSHGDEKIFLIAVCLISGILAMFLANTALLAAFFPIIDSVCMNSSNRMKQRNIILPAACAVMFGGSSTLVGCTPQLTANGLLHKISGIEMGMWTLTGPGLALFALFMIYLVFFGYKRGEKIWGKRTFTDLGISEEKKKNALRIDFDRKKVVIMFVIMTLMIISYITAFIPIAVTAMCAALLCVLFKLCSAKDIYEDLNWETIVFLGSCLGLAEALTVSDSAHVIGNFVSALMGNSHNPFAVFALLVFLSLFISQFITNSTAIIIVLPLALSLCTSYGFNPMPFCVGVTLAASVACCTPLAAAQITMTQIAGYEFSDYVRYAWPFSVISYIGILLVVPLFYPF